MVECSGVCGEWYHIKCITTKIYRNQKWIVLYKINYNHCMHFPNYITVLLLTCYNNNNNAFCFVLLFTFIYGMFIIVIIMCTITFGVYKDFGTAYYFCLLCNYYLLITIIPLNFNKPSN